MNEKQLKQPKILIINREVWDDTAGTSSTESNWFANYDPQLLSYIYCETKIPNTERCYNFFQISEFALIQRILNKRIKTGKKIITSEKDGIPKHSTAAIKEQKIMNYVRSHRSLIYTFFREILWLLNGWKSKELNSFIRKSEAEAIFIFGSHLIFMNRLQHYIIKHSNKPVICFFRDDIYTYKSIDGFGYLDYVYRFFLRKAVKRVVDNTQSFLVASPKMKREFDSIFGVNCQFLTKGIDISLESNNMLLTKNQHQPIKIVYLGQLIYGRDHSILALAESIKKVNLFEVKVQLYIYTGNFISKENQKTLNDGKNSFLMPPVPYEKVQGVIEEMDIVLFVESFSKKHQNIARLSFSTKITDYLASGKCIFAIGSLEVAPIEYLYKNNAALIASSEKEIPEKLNDLLLNQDLVKQLAYNALELGRNNHSMELVNKILSDTIDNTVKN